MRTSKGFTLIELMITVAVIAILAAVALPSYSNYVRRAKITDAAQAMSDQRLKMEQYFQDRRTYVGACQPGTVAPAPAPTPYFTLACVIPDATHYTITATGIASMGAFVFSIDEANTRQTTGVPAGWTTSTSCWVTRPDGSC